MRWSPDKIQAAVECLNESSTVNEAVQRLQQRLQTSINYDSLKHALAGNGLAPASKHLNKTGVALSAETSKLFGATKVDKDQHGPSEQSPDLGDLYGLNARTAYVRRLEKLVGERDYIGRCIQETLERAFEARPINISGYLEPPRHSNPSQRLLTTGWSDLHFGGHVNPKEVIGNEFNWQIGARRLALLCEHIAGWKPHHRERTDLLVLLNGDLIEGVIHRDDAGIRPLAEQIEGAARILTSAFDYLRHHFPRIRVICTGGNHERTTIERQVAQRWNTHANAIFLALRQGFRHDPGITFDVPATGIGSWDLPCGGVGISSHGDTRPDISNLGKSLNIAKIEAEIHRLNYGFNRKIRVAKWGHWHRPSYITLDNDVECLVNGCLIGTNSFAQNGVGSFGGGSPAQILWESTDQIAVGDYRAVKLRAADSDAHLDKIIPTPEFSW